MLILGASADLEKKDGPCQADIRPRLHPTVLLEALRRFPSLDRGSPPLGPFSLSRRHELWAQTQLLARQEPFEPFSSRFVFPFPG